MASNDGIMVQKYYVGTSEIINLSIDIGKLLGVVDATHLQTPKASLRKKNKIKTIQSSLQIEGNTLSLEQVTAIFENKRVMGSSQEITEVVNAIEVYRDLSQFDAYNVDSYLEAHRLLMDKLVENAGKYRTKGVGIFKGNQVAHMAPPASNVDNLMANLFSYLKESTDNQIIKSCVFHYEMEFVHPFMDGNGRMGRLWQTVILMKENPVFEFLPIELEIKNSQADYYTALSMADKEGISTKFVEYMLGIIKKSLEKLIKQQQGTLNTEDRVVYFKTHSSLTEFTRKDYLEMFKQISSATATRDLKKGVDLGILFKFGDGRVTKYRFEK